MTKVREVFVASHDGLQLFARDHAPKHDGGAAPVLCLPGLTRNSRDFTPALAQLTARHRVICMDFRGRGRSEYATDPQTYRVDIEARDVLALVDALDLPQVAILGTSRGGLVGMALAVHATLRIAGLLLNDIGPALNPAGLLRIRGYLGVPPGQDDFDAVARQLARTTEGVSGLSHAQWVAHARRLYKDVNGRPELDYDPRLLDTFPTEEQIMAPAGPELWQLFRAIPDIPLALLHGENSNLLSTDTVAAMQQAKPRLKVTTVKNRAHVPYLDEPESRSGIQAWLQQLERRSTSGK